MAKGGVMGEIIGGPNFGTLRFLKLEQKVSDLEKTLDDMKDLIRANNATLQAIMDAIEVERGK
jgi:Fe-S-cluster formation regulator IscX/YfhJ